MISGRARVAENIVTIRLSDKLSGRPYGQTSVVTTATQLGEFGEFNASISITHPELRSGQSVVLEVFQVSPDDGKEQDKISIPLTFSPIGG